MKFEIFIGNGKEHICHAIANRDFQQNKLLELDVSS